MLQALDSRLACNGGKVLVKAAEGHDFLVCGRFDCLQDCSEKELPQMIDPVWEVAMRCRWSNSSRALSLKRPPEGSSAARAFIINAFGMLTCAIPAIDEVQGRKKRKGTARDAEYRLFVASGGKQASFAKRVNIDQQEPARRD